METSTLKSSTPLALSVVTLTEPDDVALTVQRITAFDDRDFGFNHNQTWAAMPAALQGVLDPAGVARSFVKAPKRVQDCIVALCHLGRARPLRTHKFADYPTSGLATIQSIVWDPTVTLKVKGSCWFVDQDLAHIPLLQPRKKPLSNYRLALYLKLARRAYCKGDWADACIDLIDLSGDGFPSASFVETATLPHVTDKELRTFIETYVEAKREADMQRARRPKKKKELPMGELLSIE